MKDFYIELEIFKSIELKAFTETTTRMIQTLEDNYDFGSKTFNTDFRYPKGESGSYKDESLLRTYKRDKAALKEVLNKETITAINKDTIKRFIHYQDIFLAFNHKLSGCRKFVQKLNELLKKYKEGMPEEFNDPRTKKALKEELHRIEERIVAEEKRWEPMLRKFLSRQVVLNNNIQKIEALPSAVKNSIQKSINELVRHYRDYQEKEEELEEAVQGYKRITASKLSMKALIDFI